jgi:hypothetical protein
MAKSLKKNPKRDRKPGWLDEAVSLARKNKIFSKSVDNPNLARFLPRRRRKIARALVQVV